MVGGTTHSYLFNAVKPHPPSSARGGKMGYAVLAPPCVISAYAMLLTARHIVTKIDVPSPSA